MKKGGAQNEEATDNDYSTLHLYGAFWLIVFSFKAPRFSLQFSVIAHQPRFQ